MAGHDNEWTVATLKAYFEALRTEDQRALILLSESLRTQLERIVAGFDELKTTVERFHSTIAGEEKQTEKEWLRILNVATLIVTSGVLIFEFFLRKGG